VNASSHVALENPTVNLASDAIEIMEHCVPKPAAAGVSGTNSTFVSDLITIAPAPEKGLGIFSKGKDICAGTLLIAEDPIMVAPSSAHYLEAFQKLTPEQQAQFAALSEGSKPSWSPLLKRIYKANRFAHGKQPGDSCISLVASRMNHSCAPNADFFWSDLTRQNEVYAIFDIRPDQEITISYHDDCKALPTWVRMYFLESSWGFVCSCRACSAGPEECWPPISDLRRLLINRLYTGLTDECFEDTELIFDKLATKQLRSSFSPANQTFCWFILAKLLEMEGIGGRSPARAYLSAAQSLGERISTVTATGQNEKALENVREWLNTSLALRRLYRHPDHWDCMLVEAHLQLVQDGELGNIGTSKTWCCPERVQDTLPCIEDMD